MASRAGKPNKRTQYAAAARKRAGKMDPVDAILYKMDYWLSVVAREQKAGEQANEGLLRAALDKVQEAAEPIAPYFRAKRAAIKIEDRRLDLSKLSDKDLATLEAIYERGAVDDAGGDQSGTSTTRH